MLRLRVYHCSREQLEVMRPIDIMRDLVLLDAERVVRRVRSGGGAPKGGMIQRGMTALRAMTRKG